MNEELKKLSIYMQQHGQKEMADKIIRLALKTESLSVDLWELESLINEEPFDFPKSKIGLIGVENEEPV